MIVLAAALGFVTGCAFTFVVVVVVDALDDMRPDRPEPWERNL